MSKEKIKFEVETSAIINLFDRLDSEQQRKAYRRAVRQSAAILQKEAKKSLRKEIGSVARHKNWWNGKALHAGVKLREHRHLATSMFDRDVFTAKVHIMGDYRLKFFQDGTDERYLKKRKTRDKGTWKTGKIKANHFFTKARKAKEKEANDSFMELLYKSIMKEIS